MKYITTVTTVDSNADVAEFEIEIDGPDRILVNGEQLTVDFQSLPREGILSLLLDNRSVEAMVEDHGEAREVLIHGELYSVVVLDERAYRLSKARGGGATISGEATIKSPMPGLIISTPIKQGEAVAKGDTIIILESMKMENELRAPRDGIVLQVKVAEGAAVEKDEVLVIIGDEPGTDSSDDE